MSKDSDNNNEVDLSIVDALPPQKSTKGVDDENEIDLKKSKKKKETKEKAETIPFSKIFQFASPLDILYMVVGSLCAMASGAALPVMTIIFSDFIQAFYVFEYISDSGDGDLESARNKLNDDVRTNVYKFLILGGITCIVCYFQMSLWMIAGERQAVRIRKLYYSSILRQDIAFFDSISTGDVTTRISGDINVYQEGISEKIGFIIQLTVTFFAGFVIAFTKGWKLSLVLCSVIPLLIGSGGIMAKAIASDSSEGQDAYASAGGVAEQVLSGIRTVVAFGGQKRERKRYEKELETAYRSGRRKAFISGIGLGSMMLIMFGSYGLAFWYGSVLIINGEMTGGEVLNVFFAILIGSFSVGNATPHFASVGSASGAAAKLFAVIRRVPAIDSSDEKGIKITRSKLRGKIEFKNVDFHYPTRPDIQILKNFNLVIEPGEIVALVGASGSGKSTIVNLLERFYDPVNGSITLDDVDIKDINIKSLRSQIGLVGQEPVLFPESIKQNIIWGADLSQKEPSTDEIIEACKKANADDFIGDLPQKYDTLVGEKGALLSGGQKQRIAIARALIKDPPILLLDEATSALDTEAERLVQEALDNAATDRTSIVIAHRLSTIKNADKIVVMSDGEIKEIGRHEELINKKSVYHGLVKAQELKTKKMSTDNEDDDEEDSSISSSPGDDDTAILIDEKKHKLQRISTKASTVKTTKTDEEIREEEEKEKLKQKMPLIRIAKLCKPEIGMLILGVFGAAVNGGVMPLFSIVFASILDTFSQRDMVQLRKEANFWASGFALLAVVSFLANFFQLSMFMWAGERLTKRLRILTFEGFLRQEVAYFDFPKNGTGVLTSKLAVDATRVEGLAGSLMGAVVQNVTNVAVGFGLAFGFGWKLTLVILSAAPVVAIAGYLEMKSLAGYSLKTRKAYEGTGQIVQQSVSNMRTIASLNLENTFKDMYFDAIKEPHRVAVKGSLLSSIGFGISQGFLYFIWSLAFWYGAQLLIAGEYSLERVLRVLFAVIFCAMALGQMSTFAPNTAKAKIAALSIFEVIDRKSKIDPSDTEGKDRPAPVTGESDFREVHFNYPARPEAHILRGLNLKIFSGKKIALVGSSGSGKSTVISLLLRFYDINSGEIDVEGVEIRNWNLEYLRSNMALVAQEPLLFDVTIGENIAYGKEGCSQEEIEEAAKGANIHNFISNLPDGYDTRVGEKGAQLSGGQKQRIAIARAIIRSPKLLLLDEATSALDSESEKIVQVALDKISQGRTTVTIAHRLSTIQDADLILVCKKGKIIESGKHMELINNQGLYYELVNKQTLLKQKA